MIFRKAVLNIAVIFTLVILTLGNVIASSDQPLDYHIKSIITERKDKVILIVPTVSVENEIAYMQVYVEFENQKTKYKGKAFLERYNYEMNRWLGVNSANIRGKGDFFLERMFHARKDTDYRIRVVLEFDGSKVEATSQSKIRDKIVTSEKTKSYWTQFSEKNSVELLFGI